MDKSANIIDIGGGDSKLVDFLLDDGFENIRVLDISANSLAYSPISFRILFISRIVNPGYYPITIFDNFSGLLFRNE